MAISQEDITTHTFKIVKNGYSTEQVSTFLDMLAGEIAALQEENVHLWDRIETLEKRIVEFNDKENAINKSLIEAGEIRRKMIEEAQNKEQEILSGTNTRMLELQEKVDSLRKEEEQIKERIKYILEAQLALINQQQN